jgi:hypothetical protein
MSITQERNVMGIMQENPYSNIVECAPLHAILLGGGGGKDLNRISERKDSNILHILTKENVIMPGTTLYCGEHKAMVEEGGFVKVEGKLLTLNEWTYSLRNNNDINR